MRRKSRALTALMGTAKCVALWKSVATFHFHWLRVGESERERARNCTHIYRSSATTIATASCAVTSTSTSHHHLHLHLERSSSPHLPLRCALPPRVVALLLLFSVCRLHLSVLQPRIVVVCLLLLLVVVAVFAVGVKVKICSPYCKSLTIVELSTMDDDRVFIVVTVFVFVGAVYMYVCVCVLGVLMGYSAIRTVCAYRECCFCFCCAAFEIELKI